MHRVDYYELLGVPPTASTSEIRTAYRALAKVMHPDAGGTAGTFRLLREAYETLTDPERRADYDHGDDEEDEPPAPVAVRRAQPRIIRDDPDYLPALPDIPLDSIPWWYQLDATVVLSSGGHEREVILGAATLWAVLLLALILVSPPAPLFVVWALVLAGTGAALVRAHLAGPRSGVFAGHKVFGDPGAGSEHRAQRLTAKLLSQYLTRLPAARIFHGLAEPGSVFADVDHAVLCGRRLVLVESKMWLPGHYDIDEDGEIWRNDHPFRGGSIRLADHLAKFEDLWPDLEVRGALLLYPTRPGEITTDPTGARIPPLTPADFVRDIGGWLAKDPNKVDKHALAAVLDRVVS
ncbi:J domain-containing protein [Actinocrispum wychmicini]|uniref:J domain-containing protein n=1 Tax=Actinocrispum wychmicini TaxID=1213861 RepID=UPI00104CB799|nr:J domain-containing protein [Actinocrispum wychmicini]